MVVHIERFSTEDSPMFFGPEGGKVQATAITDEPLVVTRIQYQQLSALAQAVSNFIEGYPLIGKSERLGADPKYLKDSLDFDVRGRDHLVYGGIDVYIDPCLGPKLLEINARVQAMGLQDTRLAFLGIENQPRMVDHFISRLQSEGFQSVMVLGSKLNPFWRSHARLARTISLAGFECTYNDVQMFKELDDRGFILEVAIKLLNSEFILYSPQAELLRDKVLRNQIPLINPVSSTFYGDRGFLGEMSQALPGLLPDQTKLTRVSSQEEIQSYPWIKLEAGREFAYVVNYEELRRWGKDALIYLIRGKFDKVSALLHGKENSIATDLNKVRLKIEHLPEEQVNWIAQQDVRPLRTRLLLKGEETDLRVLHRVYWVRNLDGRVDVSLEGFGCTDSQYAQSKGKINSGSGIAIPMVIA